jgi:hypothetical protein
MMAPVRHAAGLLAGLALVVGAAAACASDAPAAAAMASGQAPPPGPTGKTEDIRHLEPRPDSVGQQPVRFSWSKVDAADTYTLRVWTEADVRVLSESGLTGTSVDFPKEYDMPAGTYFWSIVGMRGDQAVAESGLAAFVVQKP